jgi:hypothetical protein
MNTNRAISEVGRAVREALKWDRDASQFKIVRFGRHRDGYLQAQVQIGEAPPVYVERRLGSWMIPREPQSEAVTAQFGSRVMLQVLEPYSYLLAERGRQFEKAERTAADAVTAEAAAIEAQRQLEEKADVHEASNQVLAAA